MIDIEAIKARAEAATPIVAVGMSKANAEFFEHAKGDVLALVAEIEIFKQLGLGDCEVCKAKHIAKNKRLQSELDRVKTERDAAVEDMTVIASRSLRSNCDFCNQENCIGCYLERNFKWRGVERSE